MKRGQNTMIFKESKDAELIIKYQKLMGENFDEEFVTDLFEIDPSKSGKYKEFLQKEYYKGNIILDNYNQVKSTLAKYNELLDRNMLSMDEKNINKLQLSEMEIIVTKLEQKLLSTSKEEKKFAAINRLNLDTDPNIISTSHWYVAKVDNREDQIKYGESTKWCITQTNTKGKTLVDIYLHEYKDIWLKNESMLQMLRNLLRFRNKKISIEEYKKYSIKNKNDNRNDIIGVDEIDEIMAVHPEVTNNVEVSITNENEYYIKNSKEEKRQIFIQFYKQQIQQQSQYLHTDFLSLPDPVTTQLELAFKQYIQFETENGDGIIWICILKSNPFIKYQFMFGIYEFRDKLNTEVNLKDFFDGNIKDISDKTIAEKIIIANELKEIFIKYDTQKDRITRQLKSEKLPTYLEYVKSRFNI